jgi:hypothetical protein
MPSMKIFRMLIWTGFLAILLVSLYYNRIFSHAGAKIILSFEFADAEKGRDILTKWNDAHLLHTARNLTWLDFAFIVCYVTIILTLSNRQIRKEPSGVLNAMLRANFFFAIAAGLLDITENIFLLIDIHHWNCNWYFSTWWIAGLKFILAGWAVLVWLVSFVKTRIK